MRCEKCGYLIPKGQTKCPKCEEPTVEIKNEDEKNKSFENTIEATVTTEKSLGVKKIKHFEAAEERIDRSTGWKTLSILSLLCSLVTAGLGIYKMLWYENSEYSWGEHINVYVGGDAYNYIINSNYTTAYFVLTAMFVLAAIGLMILHYLSLNVKMKGTIEE